VGDVLALVAAYLIGNFSSGYLVGRLQKIDIRDYGSGNVGATNVLRTLGVWPALLTLVLDAGKGMLAVILARYLGHNPWTPVLAGILAIVGHNWPFVLHFRGGRGVATSLGVLLALMPRVVIFVAVIWFILVFFTRYISVGSIGAAMALPLGAWLFGQSIELILGSFALATLVIWRHRPNMQRLLAGEEFKIGERAKEKS
jgi:glycerol-3-phosphate acyltransferase PlsY